MPPTITADGRTYTFGRAIGRGGFSTCYDVHTEAGERLACKVVSKRRLDRPRMRDKLASEVAIHRLLSHPHVVRFVGAAQDGERAYILLERCSQRTLHELMRMRRRLAEREAARVLLQLVSAVTYLHALGVVHRDIKLPNLFLHDGACKLGDFGLAALLTTEGERRSTLCGTPSYIAPEVLAKGGGDGHSFPVDVWAIGIVAFALLVGRPPFDGRGDVKRTYALIRAAGSTGVPFPPGAELSADARDLISLLLRADPAGRPTAAAVARHPFFQLLQTPPTPAPRFDLPACEPALDAEEASCWLPVGADAARQRRASAERAPPVEGNLRPPLGPLGAARAQQRAGAPAGSAAEAGDAKRTASAQPAAAAAPRARLCVAPALCSAPCAPSCVSRWCDFSSWYGIGWELLDGTVGASFNDGSRLVLSAGKAHLQYHHPPAGPPAGLPAGPPAGPPGALGTSAPAPPARRAPPRVDSFLAREPAPDSLGKKLKLLRHFERLLQPDEAGAPTAPGADGEAPSGGALLPHVRRSVRLGGGACGAGARVFRLSNRWVQLLFDDGCELLAPVEGDGPVVHASSRDLSAGEYDLGTAGCAGGPGGAPVPAAVAEAAARATRLLAQKGLAAPPALARIASVGAADHAARATGGSRAHPPASSAALPASAVSAVAIQ